MCAFSLGLRVMMTMVLMAMVMMVMMMALVIMIIVPEALRQVGWLC
jgi:hypothetical protein